MSNCSVQSCTSMAALTANLTRGSTKLGLHQPVASAYRFACKRRPFAAFSTAGTAPQLRRSLLTSLTRAPQAGARQISTQIRAMGVTQPSDYAFDIYCKGDPKGGNPSLEGTLLDCESSGWIETKLVVDRAFEDMQLSTSHASGLHCGSVTSAPVWVDNMHAFDDAGPFSQWVMLTFEVRLRNGNHAATYHICKCHTSRSAA